VDRAACGIICPPSRTNASIVSSAIRRWPTATRPAEGLGRGRAPGAAAAIGGAARECRWMLTRW
jgi:hypothetical protein